MWFRAHNPFQVGPDLIALESGLVDDKNCLTCDRAEEIGTGIKVNSTAKHLPTVLLKRKIK